MPDIKLVTRNTNLLRSTVSKDSKEVGHVSVCSQSRGKVLQRVKQNWMICWKSICVRNEEDTIWEHHTSEVNSNVCIRRDSSAFRKKRWLCKVVEALVENRSKDFSLVHSWQPRVTGVISSNCYCVLRLCSQELRSAPRINYGVLQQDKFGADGDKNIAKKKVERKAWYVKEMEIRFEYGMLLTTWLSLLKYLIETAYKSLVCTVT